MATIPTQQTISNGVMANDGTGDSLRDAADKINNNFTELWQGTYNSIRDEPARAFVVGSLNDGYSKPIAGQMNAYNNGTPSNMTDFVNFRISQFDNNGSVRTIPVQRDWNGAGQYDSVLTATTLTMYQKTNDSSFASFVVVGQYTGNLYYKTHSNPPGSIVNPGVAPAAGERYPPGYVFTPTDSDYWYFQTSNPGLIYREGSLSAGDSCFIKIDNFW